MSLPFFIAVISAVLFGALSVILSLREDKTRKILLDAQRGQKQREYETSVLEAIHDRISNFLDIEKITDVITGSLRNLFPYSTASSLIIHDDKLIFKTYVEETVNQAFIEEVKKNMASALTTLEMKPIPQIVEESIAGVIVNEKNTAKVFSYFQVPLTVNDSVVGIINVSSSKTHAYHEEEMDSIYQIANQASNALSRLEDVLTTEKEKLLAMVRTLADGVFMVDKSSKLLVINEAAKRFLNIEKDDPTILDILSALPATFNLSSKIEKAIVENQPIEEKEVQLNSAIVQIVITPVSSFQTVGIYPKERKPGGVIGVSVLLHDITLETNMAQEKEDFTHMMVHELRAPLTAIKGSSEMMITNQKLNDDDRAKLLSIIHEQSKKLLSEVATILDAAKLDAGRFTIQKTVDDFKKVISDTVQLFKPQADTKKIELTFDCNEELPVVSFDSLRISQVVNNLLLNSLKFTQEGGKIAVKVHSDPEKGIIASVSDTGTGIPKERQGELFSKFSQISRPGAGTNLSTGLGLYISKGIVEAHGGRIWVDSEINHGTTICFTIPVLKEGHIAYPQNQQMPPHPILSA